MRAERLLRVMFLLQAHGRLTARELADRLGVSTRTAQRDLDALSRSGVPVYAERGRTGGWALATDYRSRLDGLTPTETMAVFLGAAGHVLADLGLGADADSAYAKLLATVPAHARDRAGHARERILVDHTSWRGSQGRDDHLQVLQAGLWSDRRVRLRYQGWSVDRTVDPFGLVAKGDYWYLVARGEDGAIRTYRVSRVVGAVLTDEKFIRPAGFDLAAYWEQSRKRYFASLRDYPVVLRVRREARHRLAWAPNAVVEDVVDEPDGWTRVRATFEKAHETRLFLLGLAGDIVVLEPPELREAMLTAARALIADNVNLANNRIAE